MWCSLMFYGEENAPHTGPDNQEINAGFTEPDLDEELQINGSGCPIYYQYVPFVFLMNSSIFFFYHLSTTQNDKTDC